MIDHLYSKLKGNTATQLWPVNGRANEIEPRSLTAIRFIGVNRQQLWHFHFGTKKNKKTWLAGLVTDPTKYKPTYVCISFFGKLKIHTPYHTVHVCNQSMMEACIYNSNFLSTKKQALEA